MLKELFEGHFYGTFPKIADKVLNLTERIQAGTFSLLDPNACRGCRFVCDSDAERREQMRVESTHPVCSISLDEVFSYVKEDLGETSDFLLETNDLIAAD